MAIRRISPSLLGSSEEIATLRPLWGQGATLRLWAENGLVCWETDKEKAQFKSGTMRWQEAGQRVLALSEMVAKSAEGGYASERQQIQSFISRMEHVIRKAKEQGGPDDLEDAAEQGRKRRKRSIIVPQIVNMEV